MFTPKVSSCVAKFVLRLFIVICVIIFIFSLACIGLTLVTKNGHTVNYNVYYIHFWVILFGVFSIVVFIVALGLETEAEAEMRMYEKVQANSEEKNEKGEEINEVPGRDRSYIMRMYREMHPRTFAVCAIFTLIIYMWSAGVLAYLGATQAVHMMNSHFPIVNETNVEAEI